MGCDIHQYILIWNTKENKYESVEEKFGKWGLDKDYNMEPHEFQPIWPLLSRDYWFFGVIAGVRSDEFEITGEERHDGIPVNLLPKSLEYILDSDYHSHVWYYVNDFVKGMQDKIIEMNEYLNSENNELDEYLTEDEIDERRMYQLPILCRCAYVADDVWKEKFKEYPDYDYDKTILGFFFDS